MSDAALPDYPGYRGPAAATRLRKLLPIISGMRAAHEEALARLDEAFAKGLDAQDERTAVQDRIDALARQNRRGGTR